MSAADEEAASVAFRDLAGWAVIQKRSDLKMRLRAFREPTPTWQFLPVDDDTSITWLPLRPEEDKQAMKARVFGSIYGTRPVTGRTGALHSPIQNIPLPMPTGSLADHDLLARYYDAVSPKADELTLKQMAAMSERLAKDKDA